MAMPRTAPRRPSSRAARTLLTALLGAVVVACVPEPPPPATGPDPDVAPRAADAAYTDPGPYAAGVTTLSLGDRSVEVWYPADPDALGSTPLDSYYIRDFIPPAFDALIPPSVDPPFETGAHRDVPAAEGNFPFVLFSHGAASYRLQSSVLTAHLATWGFVVASPDYFERGLWSVLGGPVTRPRPDTVVADEAIEAVGAAGDTPGNVLDGVVDTSRVFPIGHSAGGGTSLDLLRRPDVPSAIPMASGISLLSIAQNGARLPADKPIMWIGARRDGIASIDDVRTGYTYTPGEKKLVELNGSGHNNAFTDICEIGDGGLAALARATGLPIPDFLFALGNDGCPVPPFRDSPEVWPEVRHLLTAELRYRSGLDPEPVGLGSQVASHLDDVASYRHAP
jgi:hypothetical protein